MNRANLTLVNPRYAHLAGTGGTMTFSPSSTTSGPDQSGNNLRPSFIGLAHEMSHAAMAEGGKSDLLPFNASHADPALRKVPNDEVNAAHYENQVRSEWELPLRAAYTTDSGGNTLMHFLVPGTTHNARGYNYRQNNPCWYRVLTCSSLRF